MNKVAVVLVLILVAGAALYFLYTAQKGPTETPTPTTTQTPQASTPEGAEATMSTPQTATPPAATTTPPPAAAQPPFGARNYEVNYTVTVTVFVGDISLRMSGWSVVGVGPAGNYSFGEFVMNLPPQGPVRLTFKSATEGNLTYVVSCAAGQCQAETVAADSAMLYLLRGVNVTRAEKGRCTHLGYAGTLYEERGYLGPEVFAQLLGNLQGSGAGTYVANVCEFAGVQLTVGGTVFLNVTVHGQALTIRVDIESVAAKVGPFDGGRYRQLLQEAKSAQGAKA
ncbi:MAG: hypothetical protein ACO2PN_04890 [Pyrobaculum sp.]|jgi:hypothetical protein